MSAKTIFWAIVTAYYAILAVRLVNSYLAAREERRRAKMSHAERARYDKYWKWCY